MTNFVNYIHPKALNAAGDTIPAFAKYTPLWAHSFFKLNLRGVPLRITPLPFCIISPISKVAIPLLLPEHGSQTLNSKKVYNMYMKYIVSCNFYKHIK